MDGSLLEEECQLVVVMQFMEGAHEARPQPGVGGIGDVRVGVRCRRPP